MCQGCASEYSDQVNVCASDAKWSYCRCESTSAPVRVGSLSGLNPIPVVCICKTSVAYYSPSRSANGWELPNRAYPEHNEDILFCRCAVLFSPYLSSRKYHTLYHTFLNELQDPARIFLGGAKSHAEGDHSSIVVDSRRSSLPGEAVAPVGDVLGGVGHSATWAPRISGIWPFRRT